MKKAEDATTLADMKAAYAELEKAMAEYDFENSEYEYDTTPGRILYLYYDPKRCWKYVRPIHKK